MKTIKIYFIALAGLLFASCEHDNYDEPNAILSGKIVYDGNPVGLRSGAARLELWEDGHANRTKLDIAIAPDGTYSAAVFDGQYKIVRGAGAPWQQQPGDTIIVDVRGNTMQDIVVNPYIAFVNASFQKGTGNTVQAKFTVDKVLEDTNLEELKLYFSKYVLLDNNLNDDAENVDIATVGFGQEITFTGNIPAQLTSENVIFVRLGLRSNKSSEFYFTQVQKLELK